VTEHRHSYADTTDRKVVAALAACCVGPMLLIIVLTSALGIAIGPAAAITLGVVAAGLCVAVLAQRGRHHRDRP
jgi:hypothetical protein